MIPPIINSVTICGSMTRFSEQIGMVAAELSLLGFVVLMPVSVTTLLRYKNQKLDSFGINILVKTHRSKILISDCVLVVDVDYTNNIPYIGDDTKNEIEFAKAASKDVFYLSQISYGGFGSSLY